jgi:spore coat protein H
MNASPPAAAGRSFTRRRLLADVAAAAAAATLPLPALLADARRADERKAFFEAGRVPLLELSIGKRDVQSLRANRRQYVRARLAEDGGQTYPQVAVRLKGSRGSVRGVDDKPSFTLNMDKFQVGQRFHGLDKWHLNNSVQDPSYASDLLCGDLFRAAGVPATLAAHALVTLNGRSLGLYVLKEGFDKTFLRTHFGTSHGNFYDGGFLQEIDQPLELDSGDGDVRDRADLRALFDASGEPDPAERFRRLERLLHLDRWLAYLALEVVCSDWDGYPMMRNNYRVYHDPGPDKITFMPSGMDQMFGDPAGPLFPPKLDGQIARRTLDSPEGRRRYLAAVRAVLEGVFKPGPLVAKLDQVQDRVRPALASVDRRAGDGLPGRIDRLRHAVRDRAGNVDEQLAREKA